ALAKEDYARAGQHFDAAMQKALPTKKLAEVWKQVTDKSGAFQRLLSMRNDRVGKLDIVFVTCAFAREKLDVRVAFDADQRVAGLFSLAAKPAGEPRATDYVDRQSFRETEVKFGQEKWPLPGTLALPAGPGPFPAVVLVHGSGPHDRDETIGPNKSFRDLA